MSTMTDPMHRYILLDGALVHGRLKASSAFATPSALFEPLMPHVEQHLAGPLLISQTHAAADPRVRQQVLALFDDFGHRLHVAELVSALLLPDLASHLRRAVWFTDDSGESYGLRIADCRVMAYLPGILTPAQWAAITAPLAEWKIHDRQGKPRLLPLDAEAQENQEPLQSLQLTAEQVDRLIDQGEPDALLLRVGRPVSATSNPRHSADFAIADACVRHWRGAGNADRNVLLELARLAFAAGLESSRNAAWMNRAWQHAVARRR
ncbi:DUF4123 domain-containing protein [Pseudacidovorax sp. RU35E]|uniref:DUF4123 domain-containing protein n=1 Tax=Pseudacidovorax sp. RU35E TaxID=1907403 RepID=UPI000957143A|nr:DUF4123 domain-containing protein [Pseudacidovorax sp. RU35E]SIR68241.1 protein of unknown function [Pseudacidovorax sp. RU35E]